MCYCISMNTAGIGRKLYVGILNNLIFQYLRKLIVGIRHLLSKAQYIHEVYKLNFNYFSKTLHIPTAHRIAGLQNLL